MQSLVTMTRWELQCIFRSRDRIRRTYLPLFFLSAAAAVQPLILPTPFLLSRWPVLIFAFLPFGGLLIWISDSFAGERERHTLEILLLSPVPDWALVGAKLLALLLYTALSLGAMLGILCGGQFLLGYTPDLPWYGLVLSGALLIYTMLICLGMIATWSAGSLQAAQQTLLFPFIGLALILPALPALLPSIDSLRVQLAVWTGGQLGVALLLLLLGGAIGAIALVLALFRRERLLLR